MNAEVALVLSMFANAHTSMEYNQQKFLETEYYATIGRNQFLQQENSVKSVTLHKKLSMPENKKQDNTSAKL